MLKLSLVFTLVGLFVLSVLFLRIYEYNSGAVVGTRVNFEGLVESQNDRNGASYLESGDVTLICDCGFMSYVGKQVSVEGLVQEYQGRRQIRVLSISV